MDGTYSPYDPGKPGLSSPTPGSAPKRRRDALAEMNTANECLLFLVSAMFGADAPCQRPGGPCSKIADVITFLHRHFAREEERMQESGYPRQAEHIIEHRAVLARLKAMYRYFRCGHYDPKLVLDFLETWTVEHIEHHDKPLGRFLVDAEIKERAGLAVPH